MILYLNLQFIFRYSSISLSTMNQRVALVCRLKLPQYPFLDLFCLVFKLHDDVVPKTTRNPFERRRSCVSTTATRVDSTTTTFCRSLTRHLVPNLNTNHNEPVSHSTVWHHWHAFQVVRQGRCRQKTVTKPDSDDSVKSERD